MAKLCGVCALCRTDGVPLCESHLIPKFISKWAKKRCPKDRHPRFWDFHTKDFIQDFKRIPLLCKECEQKLGRAEDQFCRTIFKPYQDEQQLVFHYDTWLGYFLVSISWRYLHYLLQEACCKPQGFAQLCLRYLRSQRVQEVYESWKNYLQDSHVNSVDTQHHLYFARHIYNVRNVMWCGGFAALPEYVNMIDATPLWSESFFVLQIQFYGIFLFSFIEPRDYGEPVGTRIQQKGTLDVSKQHLSNEWQMLIQERASELHNYATKHKIQRY